MEKSEKPAYTRIVAVAENGFPPKMPFVMPAFLFYVRDLSVKLVVFRLAGVSQGFVAHVATTINPHYSFVKNPK
jgi:hypothetical protein